MSDSEEEEVRSWKFERFSAMISGRGVSTDIPEMEVEVGDLLKSAGVGTGVLPGVRGGIPPVSAVTPQQKPEKSRLVREEAGQESPVAASQKPEKSHLVLEEASEGSPVAASQKPEMPLVQEVPVVDSQEPVVLRERSRNSEECPVATPQEKLMVTRISRPSGDVEVLAERKDFWDSFCPAPGCGTWTRHQVSLVSFVNLPVRVTGVDSVLFPELGEGLETVGRFACSPGSGSNELMSLANPRIRLPRLCAIHTECT